MNYIQRLRDEARNRIDRVYKFIKHDVLEYIISEFQWISYYFVYGFIVLIIMSCGIFFVSTIECIAFRWCLLPGGQWPLRESISLNYLLYPPSGRVNLLAVNKQWEYQSKHLKPTERLKIDRSFNKEKKKNYLFAPGFSYSVYVEIKIAQSMRNLDFGRFSIMTSLIDMRDNVIASSIRPVVIPPRSSFHLIMNTILNFPLHYIGLKAPFQLDEYQFPVINDYIELNINASTKFIQVNVSNAEIDLLDIHLVVQPNLSGLSYFVFHYPVSSFVLFFVILFASQMIGLSIIVITILTVYYQIYAVPTHTIEPPPVAVDPVPDVPNPDRPILDGDTLVADRPLVLHPDTTTTTSNDMKELPSTPSPPIDSIYPNRLRHRFQPTRHPSDVNVMGGNDGQSEDSEYDLTSYATKYAPFTLREDYSNEFDNLTLYPTLSNPSFMRSTENLDPYRIQDFGMPPAHTEFDRFDEEYEVIPKKDPPSNNDETVGRIPSHPQDDEYQSSVMFKLWKWYHHADQVDSGTPESSESNSSQNSSRVEDATHRESKRTNQNYFSSVSNSKKKQS